VTTDTMGEFVLRIPLAWAIWEQLSIRKLIRVDVIHASEAGTRSVITLMKSYHISRETMNTGLYVFGPVMKIE
jgi:hypothetical protein